MAMTDILIQEQAIVMSSLGTFDDYEDIINMMETESSIQSIQVLSRNIIPVLENLIAIKTTEGVRSEVNQNFSVMRNTIYTVLVIITLLGIFIYRFTSRTIVYQL